jgi:hypothetical protein
MAAATTNVSPTTSTWSGMTAPPWMSYDLDEVAEREPFLGV